MYVYMHIYVYASSREESLDHDKGGPEQISTLPVILLHPGDHSLASSWRYEKSNAWENCGIIIVRGNIRP